MNKMTKYSCLGCKNYCPKKEVVDGYREECGGMVLVPVTKEIPAHCNVHPRYFKKWWKENGHKTSEEITEPKCIDLHEHLKTLRNMNELTQQILDKFNNKDDYTKKGIGASHS